MHPQNFESEFTLWKIEVFFRIYFEIMLCIKYDFELPRNEEGEELEEHRWAKNKREKFMANGKVQFYILIILPM